jgi:hypothetical protein
VQGEGRRGAVQGGLHRFVVQGDQGTLREVRDGAGPGQKAFLKALRIEAHKEAAKGIVGRNAVGQGEEGLQSGTLALAEELHIVEASPPLNRVHKAMTSTILQKGFPYSPPEEYHSHPMKTPPLLG